MTRFLIDTNIPSELTKPHPEPRVIRWLNAAEDEPFYLSVISLAEIVQGIVRLPPGKRRAQYESWLNTVLRPRVEGRILPVTEAIAERFGHLAAMRETQGRPLAIADGLIAATALDHNLVLVTRNIKDFTGLGLTLLNPWEGAPN